MIKRLFDVLVATVALVVLSPLLIAIAAAIRVTSRGPVLYRGVRTGRFGRPFHMLKFRTMVLNAERLGGTTTGANDPRVTRVGRILRDWKLDELPQLINVLRGEMSVVGPRPEVEEYTCLYAGDELEILHVRPGITDFASIEFSDLQSHVGAEDPDLVYRRDIRPRKNALRVRYVREASLATDMRIIAATFGAITRRSR